MTQAKISVRNVYKIFGEKKELAFELLKQGKNKDEIKQQSGCTVGLSDISLDIPTGEIFVIMGLSGSGKSTLVRHFNRLIDPTKGEIFIDEQDILKLNEKNLRVLRRKKVSMVFQSFALLPHWTVVDNAAFALIAQGVKRKEARTKSEEWLERVGLKGYGNAYPDELSGGMRQQVGLARALVADTDVILMDEAFSALDPLIRTEMQDQLLDLQNRLNKTIVFITHDLDEALRLGSKIAILKDGQVVQIGTGEEILHNPANEYVRRFVEKRAA